MLVDALKSTVLLAHGGFAGVVGIVHVPYLIQST